MLNQLQRGNEPELLRCHHSVFLRRPYVTPNQRHFGEADAICAVRQQTYSKALMENPRRWSRPPRCWKQPESVKINYPRPGT
jgi:hypothetical protein